MLFIETDSPPPFYQEQLSDDERKQLDQWFIGHRSQAYYLKRFAQFDKQGYLSAKWNWAAFFMTFPWLLYRKRYLDSIVYSVAGWSFIQLNVTLVLVIFEFLAMRFIPDAYQMLTRISLGLMVWLFWSFMVARWADAYYYRMARREIADVVNDFPKDKAAQKAHLQKEGDVSMVGLGLGFAFFIIILSIINIQFLPIIAKQKEQTILFEAYDIAKNAQKRVDVIYQQTGGCPVDFPINTDDLSVRLQVAKSAPGTPETTDCAVIATVQDVAFPNRYLNGQTLVLYHQLTAEGNNGQATTTSQWGCISSLNKKQKPKRCTNH